MLKGAGKSKLLSLSFKRKSPQSASGMGEQFCWGRGSSGLLWAHFSVTCGNSPLCSAHRAGNIFLEFFPNTHYKCGAKTMAQSGESLEPARASWILGSVSQHHKAKPL